MILPGLSGAYILLIMGVYQTILTNIRIAQDLIYDFDQDQFYSVSAVLSISFRIISWNKSLCKVFNLVA